MNFWHQLKKPILCLAPMEDVTDAAFRQILAKYGKPDVIFTEFASTDGLCSAGKDRILKDLTFSEIERPIVAQLFGSKPDHFYQAAEIIKNLGFDGIDINMGCPDKDVIKQSSGSDLINHPDLAREIIKATKAGAGDLPVSVKTRIGFHTDIIAEWIGELLKENPAAITIHGRTKKEMFKAPCHWESIALAKEIAKDSETLILGNGDIQSREAGIVLAEKYNLDGVMMGRAIFGNPWYFNPDIKKSDLSLSEILTVLIEHSKLFEELLSDTRHFINMRKHFAWYLKGIPETKDLKIALMSANNFHDVENTVNKFLNQHSHTL